MDNGNTLQGRFLQGEGIKNHKFLKNCFLFYACPFFSPHRGNHVFQTLRVYPPLHRRTCVCADRISSAAAERVFSQSVQLRKISSDYAEIWYMHTSCIGFKSLNFPFSRMNFTDFMPLLEKNGQNVRTRQSVCIFFALSTPNRERYEV